VTTSARPTTLRHPQASLEATIASKLTVLGSGIDPGDRRRLSLEIIADIKELIYLEVAEALKPTPEPEPVIYEQDLRKHLYRTGLHDWAISLTHIPTGFKEGRNSGELGENLEPLWKSQLQATADALNALEGRVRAELARTAGN
jgi:hypothetical protein